MHPTDIVEERLIVEPSSQLPVTKNLSTAHTFVAGDSGMIPVAGQSSTTVRLTDGVTLRIVNSYSQDTVYCSMTTVCQQPEDVVLTKRCKINKNVQDQEKNKASRSDNRIHELLCSR